MTEAASPWRYRSFRLLLAGRTVSLLGNGLASIAIAFAVLDLTGSATDLGVVLAARSVPQVLFLLFGGVIADRLPRARVLVSANVVAGLTQALAAFLLLQGDATIAALVLIEAVNGAASAFVLPASSGIIPQTVPASALQQANVVLRLASTTAMISGAAAGGMLVAAVGSGWGLAVDAATFLLSALCFSFINLSRVERLEHSKVWAELSDGWDAVRSRTWLWVVVLTFAVTNLAHAAAVATLGPIIADRTFGREGWGFIVAAQIAGMFIGSLFLLRVRFRRPLYAGMIGMLAWPPVMILLGMQSHFWLLVVVNLVAGVGVELFGVGWDLSLQQHIPEELLSRVYAFDSLGSFAAIPLGQLAAGPLAALVGIRQALFLCGGAALAAVVVPLFVPSVRQLERVDLPAASPPVGAQGG